MDRLRPVSFAIGVVLLALVAQAGVALAGEPKAAGPMVGVLSNSDAKPYRVARDGAIAHFATLGIRVTTVTRTSVDALRTEALKLSDQGAGAILVLGAQTAHEVASAVPAMPIVAGLVVDERALSPPNVTGVTLAISVETQLRLVRAILPKRYHRVGVIWGATTNRPLIEEAKRIAPKLGISLEVRRVRSQREIPTALESLGDSVDVLWGLADTVVLTPQTARHLLVYASRNRIPMIGPSANWARAGAFAALDYDYDDLGRQCAELVARVVGGSRPAELAPARPRSPGYALNQKTAEHMRIELSAGVLSKATKVFKGGER